MSLAPGDRHLSKKIRELAQHNFAVGVERVVFLGPRGEVRDVAYPTLGDHALLLAKRDALLSAGDLAAIAHLGAARLGSIMEISMIELYNEGESDLVSLISWPTQHRWLAVPQDAMDRWRQVWQEGDEEEI